MRYNARITTQIDGGIRTSVEPFALNYDLAVNWVKIMAKVKERNGYVVSPTARGFEATKGFETVRVELEAEHA